MKSSLAFMGAVLVAFATGTLLVRAIDVNHGTSFSHPSQFLHGDRLGAEFPAGSALSPGFAPDSAYMQGTTGAFVPNLGQVGHDIYFQFIGRHRIANFRATSIGIESQPRARSKRNGATSVDVRFIGANRRPEVRATAQADSRLSYVGGTAGESFTASVPLFSEVTYSNLYEGIDLQISASEDGLNRRFTIEPGTPSSRLLLYYDGAGMPQLLSSGALRISTPTTMLTYSRPSAYQRVGDAVVRVSADFEMGRYGAFGFKIGHHNPGLPLVIEVGGV